MHRLRWLTVPRAALGLLAVAGLGSNGLMLRPVQAQTGGGGAITLSSDVQEANTVTGVIVARGNVQIDYPAEQIFATSAQAQYFSQEGRIVLSGDVFVRQEGNSLRAETVTYLVEEGRFVALPQPNRQVESVYILPSNGGNGGNGNRASQPNASGNDPRPEAAPPPSEINVSPIPTPSQD
jgi:lipopolysaccharide export system protein LptA